MDGSRKTTFSLGRPRSPMGVINAPSFGEKISSGRVVRKASLQPPSAKPHTTFGKSLDLSLTLKAGVADEFDC